MTVFLHGFLTLPPQEFLVKSFLEVNSIVNLYKTSEKKSGAVSEGVSGEISEETHSKMSVEYSEEIY